MRHHNNEDAERWPERRAWLTDERFVKIILTLAFVVTICLILWYATTNPNTNTENPCYKY